MKWSEFKKQVEDRLEHRGLEDVEIDYIDFSVVYPDGLNIVLSDDGLRVT